MYCYYRNLVPSELVGYYVYNTSNNKLKNHDMIQKIQNKSIGLYDSQITPIDIYLNPNKDLSITILNNQMKRFTTTMKPEELSLQEDNPIGNVNANIYKVGPISKSIDLE